MQRAPGSDTPSANEAPASTIGERRPRRLRCDGQDLRAALLAATGWLERQAGAVNALNVFPVPDGDTGTNMALTMRAAVKELEDASMGRRPVGELVARVEYGALMGARGNSGVILSQILRGFARRLQGLTDFDGQELAEALQSAATMAYKAVIKPVEGTMLTVARETAEAALIAARQRNELRFVMHSALEAARASVRRTPEHLELLRRAGVVDAGGQGLAVLLEGVALHFSGQLESATVPVASTPPTIDLTAIHAHHDDDYGYCTNFMIRGEAMPFDDIRAHLASQGTSAVIVGDELLIKVHLHTLHPGASLEYALQFGALTQVKIDNMDDQHAEFSHHQSSAPAAAPAPPPTAAPATDEAAIALLAVASGDGFAEILTSLGVSRVIRGGQTMNPSAADIVTAIDSVPQAEVIILPNNSNILMAARQAAELTSKRLEVVPSKTLPQGIAALLAYVADADLASNAATMRAAIQGIRTGEVTRAVRDVELDGIPVQAGNAIGLVDDVLVAACADTDHALLTVLAAMGAADAELLTLYAGQDVSASDQAHVRAVIGTAYPSLEIDLQRGGQPHYDYILSLE